ncbi:MAG TPA: hypothetical protein VEJ18_17730, partial [Planctomycetota bacterium]|nr:hypothetical protein [Planctomycetota bacterium]
MFETVDRRLEAWVKKVFDGRAVEVAFAPPGPGKSARGIGLHLFEAIPTPPLSTPRRPPLQATLRYLVTAWAATPAEEHVLLGELLFAALDEAGVDVETEALAPSVWTALQVPLRPSFVLRATARRERPEPPVRRVQHPLTFRTTALAVLRGRILGPRDIPLMGARVAIPGRDRVAVTDADGAFALDGVPRTPP